MKFEFIKHIIFIAVLIYIPLWSQTNLFVSSLGQVKTPVTVVENEEISQLILDESGFKIYQINIS